MSYALIEYITRKAPNYEKIYKKGTIIELTRDIKGIPEAKKGLRGTVKRIYRNGMIGVDWENGANFAVSHDTDYFEVKKRKFFHSRH